MDIAETYRQAITAAQAQDFVRAEQLLRPVRKALPQSDEVLYYFALTLHKLNRHEEALAAGQALVAMAPSVATNTLLANILVAAGRPTEAAEAFREVFLLDPMQLQASVQYFVLARDNDIDGVISTFRAVIDRPDLRVDIRCLLFRTFVMAVETKGRRANGQDPMWATDFDDIAFGYATADMKEWRHLCRDFYTRKPNTHVAADVFLLSVLADGDLQDHAAVERVIAPTSVMASAITSPDFYRMIDGRSADETVARFSASKILTEPAGRIGRAIFVGCDQIYFDRYMRAFIGSAITVGSQVGMHVHVFDPDEAALKQIADMVAATSSLQLRITVETTGASSETRREYYHAVRFIRLLQYRNLYEFVWLLDADFLLHRDPSFLFDDVAGYEIGLAMYSGRADPNNRIAAGVIGLPASPFSHRYLKLVAGYLAECWYLGRLPWGADQMALYLVMLYLRQTGERPKIYPITEAIMGTLEDGCVFWPARINAEHPNRDRLETANAAALEIVSPRS